MKTRFVRGVGLALVLAWSLHGAQAIATEGEVAGRPASDDADKRARELFIRADRMYSEGDYEGALEAFSEAYSLSGRAPLLYNMANAHERLGEYGKALERLRAYYPDAPKHQQDMLQKRMQSLQLRADEQRVKAEEDAARAGAAKADDGASRKAEPTEPIERERSSGAPPYVGYALIGAGALGLGLGTYFGLQAKDARSEAEELCPNVNGERRCTAEAKDAIDRDRSRSLMADVGFGLGVAAATVGVILVLRHGAPDESGAAPAVMRAGPRAGGGQVDLLLRF